MSKVKDWWNEPITNGKIVKSYAKSMALGLIGMAILNMWCDKKLAEIETDTVIYTDATETETEK
jgi:hypothetical protein